MDPMRRFMGRVYSALFGLKHKKMDKNQYQREIRYSSVETPYSSKIFRLDASFSVQVTTTSPNFLEFLSTLISEYSSNDLVENSCILSQIDNISAA